MIGNQLEEMVKSLEHLVSETGKTLDDIGKYIN
jgi:hypothetical protein